MRATPAPARGAVVGDRDRPARALRVTAHPEAGLVVVSLWDGDRCTGTLRLDPADAPDLVRALAAAAVTARSAVRLPRAG